MDTSTLISMDTHIYIWKDNVDAFKEVDKKNELVNKLLKVYFEKHKPKNTVSYEPMEASA